MTERADITETAAGLTLEQIREGACASFDHRIEPDDLNTFVRLTGDRNPLHTDREFAVRRGYRDRVVHGAFLCGLASRLIGMELPGRNALLLSLDLRFAAPTYLGDLLHIEGTVTSVHASQGVLVLGLEIRCGSELRAKGKALVRLTQDA